MNFSRLDIWPSSGSLIRAVCFSALLMVVSMGCGNIGGGSGDSKPSSEKAFFDLAGYFSAQTERLAKASGTRSFRKSTTVEGVGETHDVKVLDFEKELLLFSKSDINKPNWSDKYEVDSVFEEGSKQLVQVRYTAMDEKLTTKTVRIGFNDGAVAEVYIENTGSSVAFGNTQKLIFRPDTGYSIESNQRSFWSSPKQFFVQVDFL